jgi:hypothetical protein
VKERAPLFVAAGVVALGAGTVGFYLRGDETAVAAHAPTEAAPSPAGSPREPRSFEPTARATRAEGSPSSSRPPPPPPPPPDRHSPGASGHRSEAALATYTARFSSETPDPAWAGAQAHAIETAIEEAPVRPRMVSAVDCRATVCRYVARFESEDDYNAFFDGVFLVSPDAVRPAFEFGQALVPRLEATPDGGYEAEMFVTRRTPAKEMRR